MMTAEGIRGKLPVPVIKSHGLGLLLGTVAFVIGLCWLFDSFDGQGRDAPFPLGAILPW